MAGRVQRKYLRRLIESASRKKRVVKRFKLSAIWTVALSSGLSELTRLINDKDPKGKWFEWVNYTSTVARERYGKLFYQILTLLRVPFFLFWFFFRVFLFSFFFKRIIPNVTPPVTSNVLFGYHKFYNDNSDLTLNIG